MKFNFRKPKFKKPDKKTTYVFLASGFVLLLVGVTVAYNRLSPVYEPKPPLLPVESTTGKTTESQAASSQKPDTALGVITGQAVPQTEQSGNPGSDHLIRKETVEGNVPTEPSSATESKVVPKTEQTNESVSSLKAAETEKPNHPKTEAAQTTAPPQTTLPETKPAETTFSETEPAPPDPNKNTAPDFSVLNASGSTVKLSDFFGKPIVINFWATWCPPCKRELPDFDKLCREYSGRITFMMVNLTDGRRDTVDGTKSFVSQNGYTFPVYFDTEYSAADAYNVSSIPQTTFIDKNGNVYTTRIGAMNEATLRGYLDALLGG